MADEFTSVAPVRQRSTSKPVIPEGYHLEFTAKGIPWMKKNDDNKNEDEDAANEHVVERLPLSVSMDEIEKRYGMGIRLYFDFLKFIMISNAFLTVIAFAHWITYLAQRPTSVEITLSDLWVSSYPSSLRNTWLGLNILGIIFWFLFGPIYFMYIKLRLQKLATPDHDNPYAFSGMGLDDIKDNIRYTSTQRFTRRIGVYSFSLLLLCISGGITFGIQYSINTVSGSSKLWISFVVTGAVIIVNLVFVQIAGRLTAFEKHRTWSQYRKHEGFKILTFRIVNVIAMYIGLQFSFVNEERGCPCFLEDSGFRFFTLILTDLVVMNIVELAVPTIRVALTKRVNCLRGKGGDEASKPEFDVATEYLELFYRQFIIYLGMMVFPGVTLLGLIANIVEYPLDKYRMLRICQKPKRLDLSMKRFLVFYLVIIAVVALLCWPQGTIWVLSGTTISDDISRCCYILQ